MTSRAMAIHQQPVLSGPSHSYLAIAHRALRRDKAAVLGLVVLVTVLLIVLLAPWLSPYDPTAVSPARRLAPVLAPGHWLGTDELGRDIVSRLVWGGRISLTIGIVPVFFSTLFGGLMGLTGGYFGHRVDSILMRSLDVLLAFPSVLLAVGISAALGPSIRNVMIALVVVGIPTVARIVRASVLQIREFDFVLAAHALGSSRRRVIFRHILPNVLAPVIVFATLETGRVIILAAGLNFLGLGVQPPTPDWGVMLATGRQFMFVAPHVATIPGLLIFVVTISLNMLGDGLRDAFDPRLRRR